MYVYQREYICVGMCEDVDKYANAYAYLCTFIYRCANVCVCVCVCV